jgi:hypothetical protein
MSSLDVVGALSVTSNLRFQISRAQAERVQDSISCRAGVGRGYVERVQSREVAGEVVKF